MLVGIFLILNRNFNNIKGKGIPNSGACAATVIVMGNGHGDPSSNPGRGCLYFK